MSRATISTSAEFGETKGSTPRIGQVPMKVAVVGDFSARESRDLRDSDSIANRPAIRVNKDTFHRALEAMSIRVRLPFVAKDIAIMDYDDLHPDYLYSRVPLFKEFIDLEKKLSTPEYFEAAANEIQQLSTFKNEQASQVTANSEASSMLDAILAGNNYQATYRKSISGQIDQLIKDIVAPYVAAKTDPRQDKMLEAVNSASSETMRKLMHNSAFQQLEASWRSLHLITKRLDSHPQISIDIFDISKPELLDDLAKAGDELENAQIFKRLISSQTTAGDIPYNVIVGDFYIEDAESDLALLIDMATMAEAANSVFIAGGDCKLAGCPTLAGSADPDDWYYKLGDEFKSAWQAVREYSGSAHVSLISPKFLLRLPYGKNTSTTDCFDFEELSENNGHKYYLWGNSAYLMLLKLCENYAKQGMNIDPSRLGGVDSLPLHVYQQHGSRHIKPCAEAMLNDAGAKCFLDAGLSVLRSIQQSDSVELQVKSLHESGALKGPWCE
ncbi:MAG: type VI secretion system contractile sheath large subunit [Cellvibrionaceae bacterium]|nr:type VI secretion system contractile sheath large subunit [Cellvibrionaceae bacterium]